VVFAYRSANTAARSCFQAWVAGWSNFEDSQRTENIGAPPRTLERCREGARSYASGWATSEDWWPDRARLVGWCQAPNRESEQQPVLWPPHVMDRERPRFVSPAQGLSAHVEVVPTRGQPRQQVQPASAGFYREDS